MTDLYDFRLQSAHRGVTRKWLPKTVFGFGGGGWGGCPYLRSLTLLDQVRVGSRWGDFINFLGSSLIWTCRILNIKYLLLFSAGRRSEKIKTNVQNSKFPMS